MMRFRKGRGGFHEAIGGNEASPPLKRRTEARLARHGVGSGVDQPIADLRVLNADSRSITASCMTIGQLDNVYKPLRFENRSVSENAKIQENGKEIHLTDLRPGTGVFLELEASELALVVVGIEKIDKTKPEVDKEGNGGGNKR
jgi:hypothetical protein